jgi:DNA-binding CsgD family transcriptional regulator
MDALAQLTKKIYAASLDRSIWWRVTEDIASLTCCNRIWFFGHSPDFVPTAGHLPKIPIDQVIDFIARSLGPEARGANGSEGLEGALVAGEKFWWVPFRRGAAPTVLAPDGEKHRVFSLALAKVSRDSCDAMRREFDAAAPHFRTDELVLQLSPHILASHDISRTLARNRIYLGGAEPKRGRQAVFLLGQAGKVLFANSAAEDLLRDEGSGLALDGGALGPSALWNAGVSGTTWQRVPRENGSLPLFSLVFPLDREQRNDPAIPRSVVIVCDPEMRAPQVTTLLRQTWPLTAAEAKVASQIFLGRGIDEVAAKLDVTRETIRTHLKRTFAKTGTSNQAELVAFVAAIQSIYFPF